MTQMRREEEGAQNGSPERGCCHAARTASTTIAANRCPHSCRWVLFELPQKIGRHLGFGSKTIASKQHSIIDDERGILYVLEVFQRKRKIVVLLFQIDPDQSTLGWRLDTNGKVVGQTFRWSIERQVATPDPNPAWVALAEEIVRFLVSFYEKEGFPKVKAASKSGANAR